MKVKKGVNRCKDTQKLIINYFKIKKLPSFAADTQLSLRLLGLSVSERVAQIFSRSLQRVLQHLNLCVGK
jgi:hypothetical protein